MGESVILRLTSLDRPHGFFLKLLKIDIAPGRTTHVALTTNTTGEYQDVWSAQSAGPGIKGSRKRYMRVMGLEADQNRLQLEKWSFEICGLQLAR